MIPESLIFLSVPLFCACAPDAKQTQSGEQQRGFFNLHNL